jgi:hypothetical protein
VVALEALVAHDEPSMLPHAMMESGIIQEMPRLARLRGKRAKFLAPDDLFSVTLR